MLDEVRRKISAFGALFDLDVARETREAYRPLMGREPDDVAVSGDVAYGPEERQKLDLYAPAQASDGLRVLLFVPGGGFVGGDKDGGDGFYGNVGRHFASRGFVTAVMNYRLAPKDKWPAGHRDVALAVGWLRDNAARLGADPNDISVFGQSAGATHTLAWYFDPGAPRPEGISAIVLASGSYRIRGDELKPNVVAYFGDDPATFEERSALTHVRATPVPFLLMVAEFDPAFLATPTFELAAKLSEAKGAAARVAWLKQHNHISPVLSIGTPDKDCAELIGAFLAENRGGPKNGRAA